MILAAADPELHSHYSTGAYALGIVEFLAIAAVLLATLGWLRNYVGRRVHQALNNGDTQILRAVEEAEAAHARRPHQHITVPTQLERNHR